MQRISLYGCSLAAVLALTAAGTLNADTLHVDDDGVQFPGAYTSIQDAIDAADDDDTILVAQGTYWGFGTIENKSLTVIGVDGPSLTHIDCYFPNQGWKNGIIVKGSASWDTTVRGFTVRHAIGGENLSFEGYELPAGQFTAENFEEYGAVGSALRIIDTKYVTIEDCHFKDNYSPLIGGAAFIMSHGGGDLDAILHRCHFHDNNCDFYGGALAIFGKPSNVVGPKVTISECHFEGNYAASGSAAYMFNTRTSNLEYCTVVRNKSALAATLLYEHSFGQISDCTIKENETASAAAGNSAGIYNILADNGNGVLFIWRTYMCGNLCDGLPANVASSVPDNGNGTPAISFFDSWGPSTLLDECPPSWLYAIKTHWPELWWWWMDIPVGPIQLESDILESWTAVRAQPGGNVAVVDSLAAKIVLFDGATGAYRSELANPDVLFQPIDVAFAPDYGMTAVLDRLGGVKVFSSESGEFLFSMHDEFSQSLAMAFDPTGRVYMLTDNADMPIQVWHLDGGIHEFSLWDQDLENPRALTVDSFGRVYVLDTDGELFRFSGMGELEAKINLNAYAPFNGQAIAANALSVQVDDDGTVFILDGAGVHQFSASGSHLGLVFESDPDNPFIDFGLQHEVPAIDTSIQGDLNGDGVVNGADMGLLLAAWGPAPAGTPADLDSDAVVGGGDLGLLLANWTG